MSADNAEVTQAAPAASGRLHRTLTSIVSMVAAASIATIVLVARRDPAGGAYAGMLLTGVVSLAAGAAVIAGSWYRRRQGALGERPRLLLGQAIVIWAIGQGLTARQLTPDGQRAFGLGDLVGSTSLPVLVLALVSLPRRSRASRPALRLTLDALIVTTAVTLGVWWLFTEPSLPDTERPGASVLFGLVTALLDVTCAALTLMVWVRDRRPGSASVAIGAALQAVADISSMQAVVGGHPRVWVSAALWCVAFPMLAIGILAYAMGPQRQPSDAVLEDLGESWATLVATVTSLALLGTAVALALRGLTPVGVGLGVATLVLLMLREIVNTVIRNRMVGWLNLEALRDVLTGLPNRSALTAQIRSLDVSRQPWVLLSLDLDGFKEMNDLLGPEAGDGLIVQVAELLRRRCPSPHVVARMGGDEFAVLLPGDVEAGRRLAVTLCQAVRQSSALQAGGVVLTASVGVGRVLPDEDGVPVVGAAVPASDLTAAEAGEVHDRLGALLESAAALRAAKSAGRGHVEVYPGRVEQARSRHLLLERRLRSALDAGELDMHAQPLVDLASGRIVGFESLARWTDQVLGPVSPAEFVAVAEQNGLVTALGDFALCNTLLQARQGGVIGSPVEIGVNVSPIQLRDPGFAPMVLELVSALAMRPDQLLLEVTEAILVDEDDLASGALARLSGAGVKLGIDDFGTGYSALGYLRRIPMNELKIDRSWVVASVTDQRTQDIVGGVVGLAHTLGATVVMEGIEDEVTAQLCRDLGADIGQGWLFGRPKPWPAAAAELAASSLPHPPLPRAQVAAVEAVGD